MSHKNRCRMKKNSKIIKIICLMLYSTIQGKSMQPNEIKSWLELDSMQKNITTMMRKYQNMQAHLKDDANHMLEKSIEAADELAKSDPYAALVMHYDMQRLIKEVNQTSLDIDAINEKYEELSDYINQSIKELLALRRKSLQFP